MTAFAQASSEESRRIMEEFLDHVFADHQDNPFATRMHTALPVLPDEPSAEQIDAWVELAGLVQDSEVRARIREIIVEGERQREATGITETDQATQRAGQAVVDRAGMAVSQGMATDSAEALAIVNYVAPYSLQPPAKTTARDTAGTSRNSSPSSATSCGALLATQRDDHRVDRPAFADAAYEWFMAALDASLQRGRVSARAA